MSERTANRLDVPSFKSEKTPMILVSAECVHFQLRQLPRGSVQERATGHHLIQEQRIGPVDDRQIHLAIRDETLEFVSQLRHVRQRRQGATEPDADIDVAAIVRPSRYR